jgi:hypothetical protein
MTSHANVSYLGDAILYTAKDGQQFTYSPGDFAWVLSSGAFVLMMCVLCFARDAGSLVQVLWRWLLLRRALAALFNALNAAHHHGHRLHGHNTVVCLRLYVRPVPSPDCGGSVPSRLSFSSGSSFLGDLKHIALTGAMAEPSDAQARLPRLLEAVYQLQFAIVTVAIAFGSAAERGSIGGTLLLAMCWATLVYPPIAHAVWHPNGFLFRMGA